MLCDDDEYRYWRNEAGMALSLMRVTLQVRDSIQRRSRELGTHEFARMQDLMDAFQFCSAYHEYAAARAELANMGMTVDEMLATVA